MVASLLTPIVPSNAFVANKCSSSAAPATLLSGFRSKLHMPAPETRLLSSSSSRGDDGDCAEYGKNQDKTSSAGGNECDPLPPVPDDARSQNEDEKSLSETVESDSAPPHILFPKSLEGGNFNPFERKRQSGVTSNPLISSSIQSARRLKMSEITSALLRSVASLSEMDRILRANKDFLLEQLEDEDAVLDVDSIYTSDMDRGERFRRYGEVMDERIEGAKNGAVVQVLRKLKDFVLSFE